MNLEDVTPSEAGHKRTHTWRIPLCEVPRGARSIEPESRWGRQGPGAGGREPFHGDRVSVWEEENIVEVDGGRDRRTVGTYKSVFYHTLKK